MQHVANVGHKDERIKGCSYSKLCALLLNTIAEIQCNSLTTYLNCVVPNKIFLDKILKLRSEQFSS